MEFYDPTLRPESPQVLPKDYVQSVENMSASDFLKIYLEALRFQDPFNQTDLSKSLEDMVRIQQIQYFTDMKTFLEELKGWLNQITFLNTATLIGKEFLFRTDTLDTIKRDTYYLISDGDYEDVKVRIYDGDELVKELEISLKEGVNEFDVSELPEGQFRVEFLRNGLPVEGIVLAFRDSVKAVGIINQELVLDLASGVSVGADRIVYVGG
ncbi:flagellar hook assembly protein FlgD [Aquifex sp.]